MVLWQGKFKVSAYRFLTFDYGISLSYYALWSGSFCHSGARPDIDSQCERR